MPLEYIRFGSKIILLIIAIWAIVKYHKLHTRAGQLIAGYLWFKGIFEIISTVSSLLGVNNFPGFYLYGILEGIFILEIIAHIPLARKITAYKRLLQVLFVVGISIESFFVWRVQFNVVSRMAECIILTAICFWVFVRLIYSPYLSGSFTLAEYWFLISVMVGLAAHAIILYYINYAMTHLGAVFSRQLWLFNYISITLSNLLLSVGLWVASKPIKSPN